MIETSSRALVVQYAGDYLQVYKDLHESGIETYHGQRYAVDTLAEIGKTYGQAAFLCCRTSSRYDVVLPNGLGAIGAAADPYLEPQAIIKLITAYKPTHLVVHAPMPALIRWAIGRQVKTLALFANYFPREGVRRRLRNFRLKRLLNDPRVDWVANHNIDACRSTEAIGVKAEKIIPWDWPHTRTPEEFEPKSLQLRGPIVLAYVGLIEEAKGVGDIVAAIAELRMSGIDAVAKIAGRGETDRFVRMAEVMGVGKQVEFLGIVPHAQIVPLMREADAIIVPSHHHYPEGLPLTIYEALCSRTPLIASDHPMFRNKLTHRHNALIYPAGRPVELADCVRTLVRDGDLYERLSRNASEAWRGLQVRARWGDVLHRWIRDSADDREWLALHSLRPGERASTFRS